MSYNWQHCHVFTTTDLWWMKHWYVGVAMDGLFLFIVTSIHFSTQSLVWQSWCDVTWQQPCLKGEVGFSYLKCMSKWIHNVRLIYFKTSWRRQSTEIVMLHTRWVEHRSSAIVTMTRFVSSLTSGLDSASHTPIKTSNLLIEFVT